MNENNIPEDHETEQPREPERKPSGYFQDVDQRSKSPEIPAVKSIQPAEFPKGFWRQIDYMLHHPDEIMESLRLDKNLWILSRLFFMITLFMAALYGAVMGATNLLQGSEMTINGKLLMILVTGIKVPSLFLLTLFIVLPPIYVSNAFAGARNTFRQMLALLMASLAITTTILASMASVAFFFALTSGSYDFIKLLHVLFFAYAGVAGLYYLEKSVKNLVVGNERSIKRSLFLVWLLLYMFVGTQLAWVLRPFVGSPNMPFTLFRERTGNFYESVIKSTHNLIKDKSQADKRGSEKRR